MTPDPREAVRQLAGQVRIDTNLLRTLLASGKPSLVALTHVLMSQYEAIADTIEQLADRLPHEGFEAL